MHARSDSEKKAKRRWPPMYKKCKQSQGVLREY